MMTNQPNHSRIPSEIWWLIGPLLADCTGVFMTCNTRQDKKTRHVTFCGLCLCLLSFVFVFVFVFCLSSFVFCLCLLSFVFRLCLLSLSEEASNTFLFSVCAVVHFVHVHTTLRCTLLAPSVRCRCHDRVYTTFRRDAKVCVCWRLVLACPAAGVRAGASLALGLGEPC
jgi:hypothetical protein